MINNLDDFFPFSKLNIFYGFRHVRELSCISINPIRVEEIYTYMYAENLFYTQLKQSKPFCRKKIYCYIGKFCFRDDDNIKHNFMTLVLEKFPKTQLHDEDVAENACRDLAYIHEIFR
jgi:hypothetical protein